jgi:hypothetical protein
MDPTAGETLIQTHAVCAHGLHTMLVSVVLWHHLNVGVWQCTVLQSGVCCCWQQNARAQLLVRSDACAEWLTRHAVLCVLAVSVCVSYLHVAGLQSIAGNRRYLRMQTVGVACMLLFRVLLHCMSSQLQYT